MYSAFDANDDTKVVRPGSLALTPRDIIAVQGPLH